MVDFVLDSANETEITWNIEPVPVENHCMFIDSKGAWRRRECDQTAQAFICETGVFSCIINRAVNGSLL